MMSYIAGIGLFLFFSFALWQIWGWEMISEVIMSNFTPCDSVASAELKTGQGDQEEGDA